MNTVLDDIELVERLKKGDVEAFDLAYKRYSGKLVFRGDPMAEVARRIERWYNVKVVLSDKELERYSFHATFEDDKLESVLRVLSMTSPISYRITPRKQMQDGTWEKEIITIHLKNV